MKRNAIIRIIVWSLALAILLAVLIGGLSYSLSYLNGWKESSKSQEVEATVWQEDELVQSLPAQDIRELHIDWAAGSIQIQSGDTDAISISESPVSDASHAMVCRRSGNALKISFCENSLNSLRGNTPKDLTVLVPKNWDCRKLDIDAASARLSVRGLTMEEVSLDTASGKSRFEDCSIGELDVDTASGDIYVSGSLKELDCDSASGSVEAELTNVPRKLEMDTASGSLDLKLPKDAGFTVKLSSLSGGFESDFPTTRKGERYLCGDGACKISMDSMSGKVSINQK